MARFCWFPEAETGDATAIQTLRGPHRRQPPAAGGMPAVLGALRRRRSVAAVQASLRLRWLHFRGTCHTSMCTAYEIGKRGGSFPARLQAEAAEELLRLRGTHIVRPTHLAPVVLADGTLATMRWGFRRQMKGKIPGKKIARTIVNAREDKLGGHLWRESAAQRRCLIPAASFFEWVVRAERNVPLRFHRPDDSWLWIAGIWEEHPELGLCYSMITTEPNHEVAAVHDRMPAVLADSHIETFLDGMPVALGPSPVPLAFAEVPNFLTPAKTLPSMPPPPVQGELF